MQGSFKKNFDFTNMLIFAKSYEKAFYMLADMANKSDTEDLFIVHLRYIELAVKLDRAAAVLASYEDPKSPLAHLPEPTKQLALYFAQWHGQFLSAFESREQFKNFLNQHPKSAPAHYGLACCLEYEQDFEQAIFHYEKSIAIDESWAPSYFNLSQIFYDMNQEEKADHFFFAFEKRAPFNLYGNFEIHRKVALEFLEIDFYEEAEQACRSLTEWWVANKGLCPLEIKIFESSILIKIYSRMNLSEKEAEERRCLLDHTNKVLQTANLPNYSYYFVANLLEEQGFREEALNCYLAIVRKKEIEVEFLQKIGVRFFTVKAYDEALQIFEEAYKNHPNNEDVRFCKFVALLKKHQVSIEAYLEEKNRFYQQVHSTKDQVKIISSLHKLLNICDFDPDVLGEMADTYIELGNHEEARFYYEKMYAVDPLGLASRIKQANFLILIKDLEKAKTILDPIEVKKNDLSGLALETLWLKAKVDQLSDKPELAVLHLEKLLIVDAWNESYLNLSYLCLFHNQRTSNEATIDEPLFNLLNHKEPSWELYDEVSAALKKEHRYQLCYVREKIALLHQSKDLKRLVSFVDAAVIYDPLQGARDLIKLINTNFDHPYIYVGLGDLYQEMNQYENAVMWYDQALSHLEISEEIKMITYKNIALCYVFLGRSLPKAIAYIKIIIDAGLFKQPDQLLGILAHAYLKNGDIKQAQVCLDQMVQKNSFESQYLLGLVQYRNGFKKNAKDIWKSLISMPVKDRKNHHLKSELMKFYFDNEDYFKAASSYS